jgi:hypothetical protein
MAWVIGTGIQAHRSWGLATARIGRHPTPCLVVSGRRYPLADLSAGSGRDVPGAVFDLFDDWSASEPWLCELAELVRAGPAVGRDAATADLLAPLIPGKVLCAGANYYDYMAEMGFPDVKKEAQRIFSFFKPARHAGSARARRSRCHVGRECLIGKSNSPRSSANARAAEALDFNRAPKQFYKFDWVAGKAFDTGCPIGPWIVPARSVSDPQDAGLKLWINGELKRDSHFSRMIYSVAEQIAPVRNHDARCWGPFADRDAGWGRGAERHFI